MDIGRTSRIAAGIVTGLIVTATPGSGATGLPSLAPRTSAAWTDYVAATERRIGSELTSGKGFLASDFDPRSRDIRAIVRQGTPVVTQMAAQTASGVPSALVHHWRGTVLLPGAKVEDLVSHLLSEPPRADGQDILRSAILSRDGDGVRVLLRVQRRQIIRVVYNTEHLVTFSRHGAGRASSVSMATRIAEVARPGTADERELGASDDHGFLWRWHSYWRYEQVAEGVIAECESLSLSRDVPWGLGPIVGPLIERTARESMARALRGVGAHFGG